MWMKRDQGGRCPAGHGGPGEAEGPVGGRDVPELIRLWEAAKAAVDGSRPA